jgi:GNAT superfamily N-acetyltransferase
MLQDLELSIAKKTDIPNLIPLLTELFSQEHEFSPDISAQQSGLSNIIQDAQIGLILQAKINHQTVAMVNLLFTQSTALGGRVGILEDMIVTSRYHGQGLGSKLLALALTEARNHGCKRITLLTDSDNEGGQRFYQRQGFALSSMTAMRLML